ncbi:MAG: CotH kinase family protein [Flavobacteriales bacterium]|nr:CotH kinase family protein [Flavobacteriales bacterium]MCB9198510.1 CotH kinase family protein [Flavobacteriales bacterium]
MKFTITYILFLSIFIILGCKNEPETSAEVKSFSKEYHHPYLNIITNTDIPWDHKDSCSIKFDNGFIINGKIKCRGGISSKYYKHSYSLELDLDTSLFEGFHVDNDLIINAGYIDKTFYRHQLSFDIFRSLSSENIAPHCALEHIYLNNNYEGLYVVMEEVDRSLVGIDKTDSLAILIKDGGLFIENHVNFFVQNDEDLYQTKYPKNPTSYSEKSLTDLHEFLFNSSDKYFKSEVENLFDLNNIIDWHLLLLITNNGDGVVKNFYWFKDKTRKWQVIPWDYDDSFGRNGDNSLQINECGWERNILLKRLFELNINNYRNRLIDKWNEVRTILLTEAKVIDQIDFHIERMKSINYEVNFEKWSVTDSNYIDNNNFEEEIELMKNYVIHRWSELDSMMHSWETL